MEPPADLTFRDRALVVGDVLVVADLHLGKGASGGFELPVGDGADMLERFRELLTTTEPATVVVAGDLLHAFGTIPRTVEDTLDGLTAAVAAADAELVVTPGNHDSLLETVRDGPTPAHYRVGDTVVTHGHQVPDVEDAGSVDRYVIGHDHPTIEIEGHRRPCFLLGEGVVAADGTGGPTHRADLVMLPAFNRLLRGVAVNEMTAADFQSPLCQSAEALAPVVRDERGGETLPFPPLGEFRHRL
jgi:putative SbcD/Mre11-related phosphoesterase